MKFSLDENERCVDLKAPHTRLCVESMATEIFEGTLATDTHAQEAGKGSCGFFRLDDPD